MLSLEDIKPRSKTKNKANLMGLQLEIVEEGVKKLQRKKIKRPGPNGGSPRTRGLNKLNM